MRLPDVTRFGFKRDEPLNHNSNLSVVWFVGNMLPRALHTPVSCGCKKGKCDTKSCRCRKLNLLCNSSCKCSENCQNCAANPGTDTEEMEEKEAAQTQDVGVDKDDSNPENKDSDDEDDITFL